MYPGRPVPADPSKFSVYERLRYWLHNCIHNHNHKEIQERALPSRILDVKRGSIGEDQIKVVDNLETKITYVALSHCWGSSQHLTATRDTLESLKLGISILSLPKTFQDAITVTRKLGFRYLWIDSLCILQDDAEDWEIEGSKMASIYEKAIVTIAADRAKDDTEGFLSLRPERPYIEIAEKAHENVRTIHVFPIALKDEFHDGFDVDMDEEPLSQRAWALQERLLSLRMFHFGQTQVAYECRSHIFTEDGYNHPVPLDYLGQDSREKLPDFDQAVYRVEKRWRDIIEWYTKRALSHPSDKLPALAGLARKFDRDSIHHREERPEYLAGLWRSNLLEGLCWFSK
ncbi:heterokaryon incompatibility protein-domain-containing protein [Lophiotrema nucula]|uniref:Heterokaryon incompatibility protein-domain-containing protein n=1 Tax=Lophiotrema nucula TaxID=690887 RepID=A0A6A5ZSB2_9PLEO|nr:heterokaryon incompatibility protein-domain-containing protein [Lophiotrema nucula]